MVVATSRPTVEAFFADMGHRSSSSVLVTPLPLSSTIVAEASDVCAAATVAVVDASIEPAEALAVCERMRVHGPELPILALFCCPHSATAAHLRPFLATGVSGFLDLNLSSEETLRALKSVVRGHGIFHLQLPEGSGATLSELFNGASPEELSDVDVGLLKLLALGQTDHEIGRTMYLSPHTVKHRIERLRRRARARNRVQLAAWGARQDALRTILLAVALTASGLALEHRREIASSALSVSAATALSAPLSSPSHPAALERVPAPTGA
jgi:two-component system invasion response regulator UvrY